MIAAVDTGKLQQKTRQLQRQCTLRPLALSALLAALAALHGCGDASPPADTVSNTSLEANQSAPESGEANLPPTARVTSPTIAFTNLDYTITQALLRLRNRPDSASALRSYLDPLLTRTRFRHSFSDYDEALALTEDLARRHPDNAQAQFLYARQLLQLHRFDEALELFPALSLSDRQSLQRSMNLARGFHEKEAAAIEDEAKSAPSFLSLLALGDLQARRGMTQTADSSYQRALDHYEDISPFPHAWVAFRRGVLWTDVDDQRAATHYKQALNYAPMYVAAAIHLGELEVADNDLDSAIKRLQETLDSPQGSEDPELTARLGEWLEMAGNAERAGQLKMQTTQSYDDLLKRHYLAFSDHASEFFRDFGGDPKRALRLAQDNLANRRTERSLQLTILAAEAADDGTARCHAIETLNSIGAATPASKQLLATQQTCSP